MEALALTNGINSILAIYNVCYSNRTEARFEIIFLASILFEKVRYAHSIKTMAHCIQCYIIHEVCRCTRTCTEPVHPVYKETPLVTLGKSVGYTLNSIFSCSISRFFKDPYDMIRIVTIN